MVTPCISNCTSEAGKIGTEGEDGSVNERYSDAISLHSLLRRALGLELVSCVDGIQCEHSSCWSISIVQQ